MSLSYPITSKKGKCLVFSFERLFEEVGNLYDFSEQEGQKYVDCLTDFGFETKHFHVDKNESIIKENVLENLKDISDFTVLMIVIYGGEIEYEFGIFEMLESLIPLKIPKVIVFDSDSSFDVYNDIVKIVEQHQNILFYTVLGYYEFVDEFCKVFKNLHSDNFLDYFIELNDCPENVKREGYVNFMCNMNRKLLLQ